MYIFIPYIYILYIYNIYIYQSIHYITSLNIRQYLVGLYRDDGLVINLSGPEIKKKRIAIIKQFKKCGLKITRQTILKIVNFLDVEMNLDTDTYR